MPFRVVEVLALLLVSLICDIRTFKIKNVITLSFAITGVVTNILLGGFEGMAFSLAGCGVPVLALLALYALRMLGAGDVKLFAAIGAIMGLEFVLYSMAYSFLLGGLIGIGVLAVRGGGAERSRYLASYIKSCFLNLKLLDYSDFKSKDKKGWFRFTYAVVPGTLMQLIILFYM